MTDTVGAKVMDQLRTIYASSGLTQAEVAQRSRGQLTQTRISRLLRGSSRDIGMNAMIVLAEALGVSFVAVLADAMEPGREDLSPAVFAELAAVRRDLGALCSRLETALAPGSNPENDHA